MRPRETAIVAAREVREALRSRWFLVAAASFLALSLGLAALGLAGARRSGLAGFDRTTASVLNLALLFVPLVTLSLGGLGIAGESEDGSLGALLAQPVTRLEVYAGKYFGLLAAVAAAVLSGFGITGLVIGAVSGGDAASFAALVTVTLLLTAATLAVGTLLSVMLESRSRVMGASFAVWLALVYVSDLGTIGLTVARALQPAQVFILGLMNPVQQARVLGTMALTNRLEVLGTVGIYGLDHFGRGGLIALLCGMLVLTAAGALAAGYAAFRKAVVP